MSFTNFKQTVWSEHIQTELDKNTVLIEDCNREFEGEAKHGNKVKILGIARPTIGSYTGTDIGTPEAVSDSAQFLNIDQAKYFNVGVDDVDKAQSSEGLLTAIMSESAAALAKQRDIYIASLASGATNKSASTLINTPELAKTAIDTALSFLWNKGVNVGDEVVINVTPWFYNLFKDKLTAIYTDNMELVKKGIVGMYNGATIKISTNIYNDETDDYMLVRTKKAIAFAGQINETEAYRPENLFMDAVKGLDTYGAKIVRQNELYVIKAHATA